MRRIGGLVLAFALAACSPGAPDVDAVPEWSRVHSSADWWMSVAVVSAEDRWIVGGTADEGRILHYDGSTIQPIDHGAEVQMLNWVHAFDAPDLIAVGNGGGVLIGDGFTWGQVDVATDADLWGAWGASSSDVWVVGGGEAGPVILRDTGDGFEPMDLPPLDESVKVLFKVWGSGPDDVFIVGQAGTILHWDGTALEQMEVDLEQDLIGIWGTGPDRVAVVGGRISGAIALWDGESWRTLQPEGMPGLNGVWLRDDSVHVAGVAGSAAVVDFESGRLGESYFLETIVFLHAIAGTPDGVITTVGGDFSTGLGGPFLGQVFEASLESE